MRLKRRLERLEALLAPKDRGPSIADILARRLQPGEAPSEPRPIDVAELNRSRFGRGMLGMYVRAGRLETLPADAPGWLREYHEVWRTKLKPFWDEQAARMKASMEPAA